MAVYRLANHFGFRVKPGKKHIFVGTRVGTSFGIRTKEPVEIKMGINETGKDVKYPVKVVRHLSGQGNRGMLVYEHPDLMEKKLKIGDDGDPYFENEDYSSDTRFVIHSFKGYGE